MSIYPSRFKTASRLIGLVVVGMGCSVLVGWMFDLSIFLSIHPAWVAMKVNTAVAFVCAGVSLWLLHPKSSQDRDSQSQSFQHRLARFFAGMVALIGLLTFSQYLFGWDLGIDQILAHDKPGSVGTFYLGSMAHNTAISFFLIG